MAKDKMTMVQKVEQMYGKAKLKPNKALREAMRKLFETDWTEFLDKSGKPIYGSLTEFINDQEEHALNSYQRIAATELKRYIKDDKYDITKLLKVLGEDKIQVDLTNNGEAFEAFQAPWEANKP